MDKIETIRDIPDMSKDKIYTSAKQWVAKNFVSAQDVIQFDDKEAGTLIVKGNIDYPCSNVWSCSHYDLTGEVVKFTMKVDVKDQKIRVGIDDVFVHHYSPTLHRDVNENPDKKQEIKFGKRLLGLSNSLILAVEEAAEIKKDDW